MIRLGPDDISRARRFATERGVHVEAYLEELLHEALTEEEKRTAL